MAAAVQGPPPEGYPPGYQHPGYTRVAMNLIANPDRISRQEWRDAIVRILQDYVARHPLPNPSGPDIAFLVDMERLFRPEMSLREARQRVADATGTAFRTVKALHIKRIKVQRERERARALGGLKPGPS